MLAGIGRPARRLRVVEDALHDLRLIRQHRLYRLALDDDAGEGIDVDLVEVAALRADPDGQEGRDATRTGRLRLNRVRLQLDARREIGGDGGVRHREEALFLRRADLLRRLRQVVDQQFRALLVRRALRDGEPGEHRHEAAPLRPHRRREGDEVVGRVWRAFRSPAM